MSGALFSALCRYPLILPNKETAVLLFLSPMTKIKTQCRNNLLRRQSRGQRCGRRPGCPGPNRAVRFLACLKQEGRAGLEAGVATCTRAGRENQGHLPLYPLRG